MHLCFSGLSEKCYVDYIGYIVKNVKRVTELEKELHTAFRPMFKVLLHNFLENDQNYKNKKTSQDQWPPNQILTKAM